MKTISVAAEVVTEAWEKTMHFCPACGKPAVWRLHVEQPTTAPKHLCAAAGCNARFLLSAAIETDDSEAAGERIKALTA